MNKSIMVNITVRESSLPSDSFINIMHTCQTHIVLTHPDTSFVCMEKGVAFRPLVSLFNREASGSALGHTFFMISNDFRQTECGNELCSYK